MNEETEQQDIVDDGSNPFTNRFTIEVSEVRVTKEYYNSGYSVVESNKPTSIWMKPHILKAITTLSPSAKDMIFYIINHLGHNKEAIQIEYISYCEKTGLEITQRTFQRTITELTNKVIERKAARKNMYYINPDFLFKGSRINAYPNNTTVTYTEKAITSMRENGVLPPQREKRKSTLDTNSDRGEIDI